MSGHPIEHLWREYGLPEWFLDSDSTSAKLHALYDAIRSQDARCGDVQERIAELQHEAGMYKSLYENAKAEMDDQRMMDDMTLAWNSRKAAQDEIDRLEQTVDVLESNARAQAKLLADTGRRLEYMESKFGKFEWDVSAVSSANRGEPCPECGWSGGGQRDEGCILGHCPRERSALSSTHSRTQESDNGK